HVAHADVADAVFVICCLSSPRTRGPITTGLWNMGPRSAGTTVILVQHRSRTHFARTHRCVFVAERSSQTPYANRLLVAADWDISERDRIDILADRLPNCVRYQELRPEFLVEALDSGGQIHRVADHGVFLAPRRADVACHHLPNMQSYADTQRPITADILLLDRG